MAEDGTKRPNLFSQCVLAFVPSSDLPPKKIAELAQLVKDNGAEVCEPRPDGSLPLEAASHIISNTIDFPQYTETQAHMIPVVDKNWVHLCLHKGKLAQVRAFSPDPRMIFSSVVITCAGLPDMDKESIIGATMALGGMEAPQVSRLTTHICALSDDDPVCVDAFKKGSKAKIVLPHWFDDCFRLGKKIDETPYLLPDAEILRMTSDESIEVPSSIHLVGATSPDPEYLPTPPPQISRIALHVFQSKKVVLSADLSLTKRLRKIVADIITSSGGQVVAQVEECDMFICHFRDGQEYVRASQLCKDVGNLSWLYHLITHDEWTSPLRRLLHYPVPRNGIPGFENLMITISNYGGEARTYLENLITAAGATFTKTMRAENTHLITARNNSEKCGAAADWGIEMVNHLWIEESYAKCQALACSVPRYTHFPPRTNLGEIIGQTFFDPTRLREVYYPGGDDLPKSAKRKRKIMEAAEQNTYAHGPAEGLPIEINESTALVVREDSRSGPFVTPARAAGGRHVRLGKENDTPSVLSTEGRTAKRKAAQSIHSLASDIALYQKENKRASKDGSSPWGGKRAADKLEKMQASTVQDAKDADHEDKAERRRPAKKRKSLPDIEYRVLITGFTRWVGDKSHGKEDKDRRKLRDLGIKIVEDGQPCDYLAAPHIMRTLKFLRALARGPTIISTEWIDEALETGEVPDPDGFILRDEENEKKFGVKLKVAVGRARANKGRLLQGVVIFCTPNVQHGTQTYKAIATANGAIWRDFTGRQGGIKPTTAEEDGNAPPEPVYLIATNSKEDKVLHKKFEEMALNGHMEPRIVVYNWLLDVAMSQQMTFKDKYLVTKWSHE